MEITRGSGVKGSRRTTEWLASWATWPITWPGSRRPQPPQAQLGRNGGQQQASGSAPRAPPIDRGAARWLVFSFCRSISKRRKNMRERRHVLRPVLECCESRAMLSGGLISATAAPRVETQPIMLIVPLDGTFRGHYHQHTPDADQGSIFDLNGSGLGQRDRPCVHHGAHSVHRLDRTRARPWNPVPLERPRYDHLEPDRSRATQRAQGPARLLYLHNRRRDWEIHQRDRHRDGQPGYNPRPFRRESQRRGPRHLHIGLDLESDPGHVRGGADRAELESSGDRAPGC